MGMAGLQQGGMQHDSPMSGQDRSSQHGSAGMGPGSYVSSLFYRVE